MKKEITGTVESYRHSTHHVHRGPESLPCYCDATVDHPIGKELTAPRKTSVKIKNIR
jgi:hypothetical protein